MSDASIGIGTGVTGTAHDAAALDAGARVADYLALLKPRVMSLVVFSGFAGLILAPGHIHPVLAAIAVLCIAVAAGAAGAVNMWYDRDIDAVMRRTCARPIPTGKIKPEEALAFGIVLSVGSVMLMGLALNWVAAVLLATANLFYIFVYTIWLKRRTPQNIVIGGAAGAFPPMIGWAAVTGDVSLASIALFALIFMWTPPHFWALALFRRGDYEKAGVPMLPVVAGARATKLQMLLYTVILLPLGLVPWWLGITGPLYAVAATALGLIFLGFAVWVWFDSDEEQGGGRAAKRMFGYSILYLFLMFTAMMVDRAPGLLPRLAEWVG
ncbi:heme o synthase [Hypericibacter sp.]|uniref:heme o synthase n=1 Tax=Hypericibacter sp. TaxID=2705401 RepID=UPI003D6D814B